MPTILQHSILLENAVSLIRGRPPAIVDIVFLLIFIFLCWKIIQLRWQLSEKQKYIDKLRAITHHQKTYINKLKTRIHIMESPNKHIGYNVEQMTINMSGGTLVQHADIVQASGEVKVETPVTEASNRTDVLSSCLFTEKTRKEQKETMITQALQQSYEGRYDRARALATELKRWQSEGYIDKHYNAKVVYAELNKLLTDIPIKYSCFRKYYNNNTQ